MEIALKHGVDAGWSHFFYGSTDETLTKLVAAARRPGTGSPALPAAMSPAFRPTTDDDSACRYRPDSRVGRRSRLGRIGYAQARTLDEAGGRASSRYRPARESEPRSTSLPGQCPVPRCGCSPPDWSGSTGFAQEPGRLWRRYLINNPHFLWLLGRDILRFGESPSPDLDATKPGVVCERWPRAY